MKAETGRPIAQILTELTPSRKAARVRKIWGAIVEMSAAMLTYGEMAAILRDEYDFRISPKHLGSVIRRIRKNPPDPAMRTVLSSGASDYAASPLSEARQKHEEKTRPIFKGRN